MKRIIILLLLVNALQAVSCWEGLNEITGGGDRISPAVITLKQSAGTAGGLTLNWTEPDTDPSYDHTEVSYTAEGTTTTLNVAKGIKTCTINGLISTTEYTITIHAVDMYSNKSDASTFKITPNASNTLCFIYTASELASAASNLSCYYILMADIDLSSYTNWTPIGDYATNTAYKFTGTFDGNSHIINNLKITGSSDFRALFGYAEGATIKNLGIKNANVSGGTCTAILVGENSNSTINNCYVTGTVNGTGNQVGGLTGFNIYGSSINNSNASVNVTGTGLFTGGLVGFNDHSSISNCYSTGTVSGATHTGGLVGENSCYSSTVAMIMTISNCYTTCNVTGSANNVGGFVGYNYGSANSTGSVEIKINNCYSTGTVSGTTNTGGFVGNNNCGSSSTITISNCYAAGKVTGSTNLGGFVGINTSVTYTSCFYDTTATGQTDSYAAGKTTSEMKTQNTYSGWDFTSTWSISSSVNSGYPYLTALKP